MYIWQNKPFLPNKLHITAYHLPSLGLSACTKGLYARLQEYGGGWERA